MMKWWKIGTRKERFALEKGDSLHFFVKMGCLRQLNCSTAWLTVAPLRSKMFGELHFLVMPQGIPLKNAEGNLENSPSFLFDWGEKEAFTGGQSFSRGQECHSESQSWLLGCALVCISGACAGLSPRKCFPAFGVESHVIASLPEDRLTFCNLQVLNLHSVYFAQAFDTKSHWLH